MSLAMQISIALILAVAAGLFMQNHADLASEYIKPFGTIFLNLVKFIVGPIVLFSIMFGVISLKDIHKVESIGGITVVCRNGKCKGCCDPSGAAGSGNVLCLLPGLF